MRSSGLASLLAVALTAATPVFLAPAPAVAQEAQAGQFLNALAPYGRWVVLPQYGQAFVPAVTPGWRPFTRGRWIFAASYGWYWDTDEPWGWATYHYGGWTYTREHGWAWVPGQTWGAAWVSWRMGGGFIGWAPARPEGEQDPRVPAEAWVFVPEQDFLAPELSRHVAPIDGAEQILARAQRLGETRVQGEFGVNHVLAAAAVSRATGAPVVPQTLPEGTVPVVPVAAPVPPADGIYRNPPPYPYPPAAPDGVYRTPMPPRDWGPAPIPPRDIPVRDLDPDYDDGPDFPPDYRAAPMPGDPRLGPQAPYDPRMLGQPVPPGVPGQPPVARLPGADAPVPGELRRSSRPGEQDGISIRPLAPPSDADTAAPPARTAPASPPQHPAALPKPAEGERAAPAEDKAPSPPQHPAALPKPSGSERATPAEERKAPAAEAEQPRPAARRGPVRVIPIPKRQDDASTSGAAPAADAKSEAKAEAKR